MSTVYVKIVLGQLPIIMVNNYLKCHANAVWKTNLIQPDFKKFRKDSFKTNGKFQDEPTRIDRTMSIKNVGKTAVFTQ